MQTIMNDLKTLTKGVGQIVVKFAGTNQDYNWEVVDGTLPQGTAATNPPALYNSSTGTITTTFDSQSWLNATDLSWARTMLHEAVHADLAVYFAINRPGWVATYPQMVAEWGRLQNWNDVHHEEIARSIVNDISLALKEYGAKKGYNLSQQFCDDMAWAGLQNTAVFKSLPTTDQDRILNTIAVELTGKDTNGQNQPQKGTKAGC